MGTIDMSHQWHTHQMDSFWHQEVKINLLEYGTWSNGKQAINFMGMNRGLHPSHFHQTVSSLFLAVKIRRSNCGI